MQTASKSPRLSLAELVELSLEANRGKPLNYIERKFYISKFKSIDPVKFRNHPITQVVDALTKIFIEDFKSVLTEDLSSIDMHEVLKHEIGKDAESAIIEKKAEPNATIDSLLQKPNILQHIFNPKARQQSTYMLLDSRYRDRTITDPTLLKWSVTSPQGNYIAETSAITPIPLHDIVSITARPFRFPNARNIYTNAHRVSVEIVELNTQAIICNRGQKRFHFLFDIERTGAASSYAPYEIRDIENQTAHFNFHTPITQLDTLTLRFGNPFINIPLDPDQLTATLTSIGAQTLLTFSQPHYCEALDEIFILDFNTTNPITDKTIIDLTNNINGWIINIPPTLPPTSNTMIINLDISTLTGAIIAPTNIYLNSKRISCMLEFVYIN